LVDLSGLISQYEQILFAMNKRKQSKKRVRILIASSHPLFAEGLRSLLVKRREPEASVVGIVATIEEAIAAIGSLHPDLIIVDYDDEQVNRDEFLARFVEGEGRLRVVLLSLREGGSEAIVYDRRSMAAAQIEDWLETWGDSEVVKEEISIPAQQSGTRSDEPTRRGNMRHIIAAGLVVIGLMVLLFFGYQQIDLLPIAASRQSGPIDYLFRIQFLIIIFLFSLIVGLMLYSLIFFRKKAGDDTDGPHIEGNSALEIGWTVVPLVIVLTVAVIGGQVLGRTLAADPKPLRVNVVGSQWAWRFEYPDLGIQSPEMILPVDKQALLILSSTDVIHSFWVPEFRVKQDALPGKSFDRQLRITPDKVGDYKVRCSELCGLQHYAMQAPVRVLAQNDFDAWVSKNAPPPPGSEGEGADTPVARGDKLSQQYGCQSCHSIDGSPLVGPTWKGLYGSEVQLSDGTTVQADDAYLYESIRNPGAKVVAGFTQGQMPPQIADAMTDAQVADVIEFIKSLK
jgi:cytochrome c oxidase subunit II